MEYRYGTQPNPEYYPTNFGLNAAGFEKINNGYFNTVQITNPPNSGTITGNIRDRSSIQIAANTFVKLDVDRLLQYLDYDHKLTPVSQLPITFHTNLDIYYDTIRYHFLSGFDFGLADGVIMKVEYQEVSGKKATVSQITYEKGDIGITQMNPSPIYFNAGIYDNYIEVKIPSYSFITYDYDTQTDPVIKSQTIASLISSDGNGFVRNTPFTIALYEIQSTNDVNGFYFFNTSVTSIATISAVDEYTDLAANVVENTTYSYFEYYPSWQGNFIEDFVYTEDSLGNIYYVIHDIELSEQVGLRHISTQKLQVLQDSGFNQPYIYRPVVMNPKATSFTINYSMRLVNKSNNVSILRVATLTSTAVDTYGPGLKRIHLQNQPYPQKVYNKVIQPSVSKAYTLNMNPIQTVITKYVPAFFEREVINITEENLTINNLGGNNATSTTDATVAFGQGNAKIVINPYDNYFKFQIFTNNKGKENTVLDLGNNTQFFLVFEGGTNQTIKIPSQADSTFQNPNKGELVFRLVESDSKIVTQYTNRDFHITSLTANGIETSIYHGYWILPSERDQKPVPVATVAPTPAPAPVVIAPVTTPASTPTVAVIPQQPKDYFDVIKDPVVLNVEPKVIKTSTLPTTPAPAPVFADNIDGLANAISMDEKADKSVKAIADYYTIPGNAGYKLFHGMSKQFFLNAVRIVHPNINGVNSPKFIEYMQYLGAIYQDYENNKYPTGGGCFVAGTKVTLDNGTKINIENVKKGQAVLTYNEKTKKNEPCMVQNLIVLFKNDIILLKLNNGTELRSTTEHPYWVVGKGWSSFNPSKSRKVHSITVSQLEDNDILLDETGKEVKLNSIENVGTNQEVKVHNLEIDGNHTYYANGILVHNKLAKDAQSNTSNQNKFFS
jgi:hypothetical protein